ncbi:DUF3253 domain-containing protein [Starkeya sp. ORNL1]|uniref:DUF3253 domain-containing protein n=1 Tax=Starkeya sp. ORNL1 TaxID=2709380 RepID=UPI00146436B4|nr:DUF3253 domain-containing protein [Starkeya sp. ORNL1]QJP12955.1 DUF3253 domain-containing protein [Starkeya sp. ORNL1]
MSTPDASSKAGFPAEEAVEAAILALAGRPDAPRSIDPSEPARALAEGAEDWQRLLPAVRRAAVRLAMAGKLVIYRKGKPVDPEDFRGVYRLGLPQDQV